MTLLKVKSTLLLLLILLSVNLVQAQDIILMRIVENEYRNSSRIVLTFPDQSSEVIPLLAIYGSNERVDNHRIENQLTIAETIKKIMEKGFKLDNVVKEILIFRKEEG